MGVKSTHYRRLLRDLVTQIEQIAKGHRHGADTGPNKPSLAVATADHGPGPALRSGGVVELTARKPA